jgi:hypothetical protein
MSGSVIERCSNDLPLESGEVRAGNSRCHETGRADGPDVGFVSIFEGVPATSLMLVFHGYSAPSAVASFRVFSKDRVHLMPAREVRVRPHMLL